MFFKKKYYLCTLKIKVVSVAQLAEQMTLNHWVQGSSPCTPTIKSMKAGCFFQPAFLFSGNAGRGRFT